MDPLLADLIASYRVVLEGAVEQGTRRQGRIMEVYMPSAIRLYLGENEETDQFYVNGLLALAKVQGGRFEPLQDEVELRRRFEGEVARGAIVNTVNHLYRCSA